jgi:hypothetical protein
MSRRLGFLAIGLVAFVPTLWAAETAFDIVVCYHAKTMLLEGTADITAVSIEQWGIVANSTTKEFENATWHCVGPVRTMGGKSIGRGLCKSQDSAGDSFVAEWEMTGTWGEGTMAFLSGTGKFKGIQGGFLWKTVARGKPIVEGTAQYCHQGRGKYTLP